MTQYAARRRDIKNRIAFVEGEALVNDKLLVEALAAAGAIDVDIWKLARPDLPVPDAVRDVQRRYPAAFTPPFDARTAPRAEVDRRWRQHMEDMAREAYKRRNEAALAEMDRQYRRSEGKK